MCKHNTLKYFIKWKGWDDNTNTWEPEANIFDNALAIISNYWHAFEQQMVADQKSETVIRDLQGELDCPHFNEEPERLYRKR